MRWLFLALVSVVVTIGTAAYFGRPREVVLTVSEIEGEEVGSDIDAQRLEQDLKSLTAAPSRLTGSPGEAAAREFLVRQLEGLGTGEVTDQAFTVTVPVTEAARLAVRRPDGTTLDVPLHPLWPNLARTSQTPPDGLRGRLVDGGSGSEADLEGKALQDAIAVMDWDSDLEWLSVPEFGGKAVIFRGNKPSTGMQARHKFLTVPADVPRFYVAAADLPILGQALRPSDGAVATIHCRQAWRQLTAHNLLLAVGHGNPNAAAADQTPILFHACYDSISVVPDLAPGAEQACGAAVLLELGRYFTRHPAPRPVQLLFTGGHGQALAGMTHFMQTVRSGEVQTPGLVVGLDLSTRSESFGLFALGHFRGQYEHLIRHKFSTLGHQLDQYANGQPGDAGDEGERSTFIDGINLSSGRGWWTFFPYRAPFGSELATLAGIPGVTLATVNDDRRYVDTPDDTFDQLRLDLLGRQLTGAPGRPVGLVKIARALTQWKGPFVSSPLADKWTRIDGRVVWLDQRRDYTPNQPLAKATVFLKMGRGDKYLVGTRGTAVTMTDEHGQYSFDGLIEMTQNWEFAKCSMEAYGTADREFLDANPTAIAQYYEALRLGGREGSPRLQPDGTIVYAVDMARVNDYPWVVKSETAEQHANIVCFPCKSFSLLGLTDPRGYLPLTDLRVLQAATKSPPFQFGISEADARSGDATENLATMWTDPTIRILVTLGLGFQEKRLVLINNSLDKPEGSGFVLDELKTLPSMVLQGARDMWNLDETRIRKLERNGVHNPRIRSLHDQSKALLEQADKALATHDYRTYRLASERGWALEGKAYGETLAMINNMIHGVLFYLALLLPLSYCLERLLVASETIKKRILCIGGIFCASFVLLALVHPAFRFTLTPLLVLLAFIIVALVVTVSVLIMVKMDAVLQERKLAAVGRHEDQYRRGGVLMRALDLGMSNIRRRPQRGFLTGLSVVMVTFILLSFTSLVPVTSISRLRHPRGTATYRGLLARDRAWNSLPDALHESLYRSFGEQQTAPGERPTVSARGWFYSDRSGRLSLIDLNAVAERRAADAPTRSARVSALLCLEPTETRVTGVDQALVAGRWFRDDEEPSVILSRRVAEQLGYDTASVGRKVRLFGAELTLVGIVDAERFNRLLDIDGEPLTPVNFVMQQEKMAQLASSDEDKAETDTLEEYIHYSVDQVAIIPFAFGKQLDATIRSVAVRAGRDTDIAGEAAGYAKRSNLTILGSDGKAVTLYAALNTSQLSAAWQIVVPMFLGFIMILGTMLGSVYERQNEIFVYNSVGLSPTNVSSLFLAESAVYAIVGAGTGYLLGQSASKLLESTGMLSGLTLNYTAGTTILVTILAMLMVFSSAIYPARQAFRAAIPDVVDAQDSEEEGGIDAGDALHLYLPFVATPGNVLGMQAYLAEYLESIQGVTIGQLAVDNLQARVEEAGNGPVPILCFRAWMAPFDLGVSHDAELCIVKRSDRGVYQYHLAARRYSGDRQNWKRLTPRFLQAVRKQLLMWRILSSDEQQRYRDRGRELFGEQEFV